MDAKFLLREYGNYNGMINRDCGFIFKSYYFIALKLVLNTFL